MRSTASAVYLGLLGLLAAMLPAISAAQVMETYTYAGTCDASAAVALSADIFVVGNDENNTLLSYRRGQAAPISSLPLSGFLGTGAKEADIEGAAAIGSRIYWIGSHGRNSKGKVQPSRQRFFATDIRAAQPPALIPLLEPVGRPYVDLLRDFDESDTLKPYQLGAAARLAPEAEGGLNIEGLAATPDGGLLIGFRNPLRAGRALIVPLLNPGEVIEGKRAKLGVPIELNLDGRGIRSIDLVGSSYLIVAGPIADSGSFALYRWSGKAADAPILISGVNLGDLRPEALFVIPRSTHMQFLSDDGGVMVGGTECKKLDASQQSFRSITVKPD